MLKHWALFLGVLVALAPGFSQETSKPPQSQDRPRRERGAGFQGIAGSITAIDASHLILKTMDGRAVTANLSSDTRFRKNGSPAQLADFKVGDVVMVGGEPAGENAWNARFLGTRSGAAAEFREGLGKRFVAGEIKSIVGTRLTVLRSDGQTQTIEVDENTSFRKRNESITLADFKPGDHIFARGGLKDGTFVVTVLNLGGFPYAGPTEQRVPDLADHH